MNPAVISVALPVLAGMLLLYVPSVIDLMGSLWATDQNAHGPIVLAVSIWLLIRKIREPKLQARLDPQGSPLVGWLILSFGLLIYAVGRSQGLMALEVVSFIVVLMGLCALFLNRRALGYLWFPFFMMLFAVPLPGSVVDTLTQPLKIAASVGAEQLLFMLGYPIARSGVTLTIGPYQLLVADACAGLNSLFTLEALGLLYMNLVHHASVLRTVGLAILIVPISLASNMIRVALLAVITYHFGDAVGQGFVHDFSGIALFLIALLLIVSLDNVLRGVSSIGGRTGAPSHA